MEFLIRICFSGFYWNCFTIVAAKTIKIVPQSSVLLIERLGRFHKSRSKRFKYCRAVF